MSDRRLNHWLTITTVTLALFYGCCFFYYEAARETWCCDGPCWNLEDERANP